MCWNQKFLNIELDQELKNYNFIKEWILKFKMFSQFICTNTCILPIVYTIWTPKSLQIKNGQYTSCLEFFEIYNFPI